jgi:hypothetical protein
MKAPHPIQGEEMGTVPFNTYEVFDVIKRDFSQNVQIKLFLQTR